MHGFASLHCESSQHSAQPTPAQHSEPVPQSVAVCSHRLLVQASVVHGSLSSQSVLAVAAAQTSLFRQPEPTAQYWAVPHVASLGAWVHAPAKQSSSVHFTPSSQSVLSQHSPQVPAQHFSVASHLGALLHVPSAPHWSTVHGSPSSQSSGPLHALGGALLDPPELESPRMPPSAAPEPPLPLAENSEPPHA